MKSIEQQVEETMTSLDGVQRAAANPFLYTRIEQRLKNRYQPAYQQKLMPVLAVALLLFISLNVFSYLKNNAAPAATGTPASGIENFANEYNLSDEGGL